MQAIKWIPKDCVPKHSKILLLAMGYRYKYDQIKNELERKARCSVRGHLMILGEHYRPSEIATYTTYKSALRLIFAIAAAQKLHMAHFDFLLHFCMTALNMNSLSMYTSILDSMAHLGISTELACSQAIYMEQNKQATYTFKEPKPHCSNLDSTN